MGGKRRLLSAVTARCRSWRQSHQPGRPSAAEGLRGHTTATGGNGGKAAAREGAQDPHLGEARGPSPRTLAKRGGRVLAPRRSEAPSPRTSAKRGGRVHAPRRTTAQPQGQQGRAA